MDRRLQEEMYWRNRWEENRTAWQLSAPHTILVEHFEDVAPAPARSLDGKERTVFVPLSGKTLDIHWLRDQGYFVIGCEISEKAVTELFQEMEVTPQIYTERQAINGKELTVWQHGKVKIYVANFFDLGVLEVDAVFDRAALVALPAETRESYAKYMIEITRRAPQLLITFEHYRTTTPPHSVPLELINHYYGRVYDIEPIVRRITGDGIIEAAYLLLNKKVTSSHSL